MQLLPFELLSQPSASSRAEAAVSATADVAFCCESWPTPLPDGGFAILRRLSTLPLRCARVSRSILQSASGRPFHGDAAVLSARSRDLLCIARFADAVDLTHTDDGCDPIVAVDPSHVVPADAVIVRFHRSGDTAHDAA
jgi:hypothetical protein